MAVGIFPAHELKLAPGGLFSVADVSHHAPGGVSWTNFQYSWDTYACPVVLRTGDYCSSFNGVLVDLDGVPADAWPFGITTSYQCLTVGMSLAERKAIAKKQAEAATQKGVEAELWAGFSAQAANHLEARYLNDNRAVDVSGGAAVSPSVAMAKLEQAIADCGLGTQGVIHLPRQAASLASATGGLTFNEDEGHAQTAFGTPVVAGLGYNPSIVPADPSNNPFPPVTALGPQPNVQWGFITGPIYVHLGPIEVFDEYLDIKNNLLTVEAGRPAAVYWDSCCVAAVQIKVDGT
jgi:hypothetical protein